MTGGYDAAAALLTSPVRRRIVELLRAAKARGAGGTRAALGAEGLTAAQLGKALDLHVTTARFHLDQLVAAGVLKAEFYKHPGAGRPRKVYGLAPNQQAPRDDVATVRLFTALLAETLTAATHEQRMVAPEEAGFRWAEQNVPSTGAAPASSVGEWVGKVGGLIDVLDRWGYVPELSTSEGGRSARIDLSHCPFRDLAKANTEVVCGIHRGLIAGTMHQLGEAGTEVALLPFAAGETCIAHLRRATDFDSARPIDPVPDQEDSP